MVIETVQTKEELRNLVDDYAYLGDEKKISEQMGLFAPDAVYSVFVNGVLVTTTSGTTNLAAEFNAHASQVKTYFTLNGQHTVAIDGDKATGLSFSQIKMIREPEGKRVLTDYSVKYDDVYVRQQGKWLIKQRTAYFIIIDERPLSN